MRYVLILNFIILMFVLLPVRSFVAPALEVLRVCLKSKTVSNSDCFSDYTIPSESAVIIFMTLPM